MGLLWDILNNIRLNVFIKHINTQLKSGAAYLSWVKGLQWTIILHDEHVYEVDENARSMSGVLRREGEPLVKYHEHQISKQTQHKHELRDEHQVQVVLLPEVSGFLTNKKKADY